jgi:hypothetical protein
MTIWKISPGRSAIYWPDFLQQQIIAIGWLHRVGDLDKLKTPIKIKEVAIKNDYSINGSRPGYKQVIEFYLTRENDIVVAFGKKKILDIGVIDGPYYYDNSKSNCFHNGEIYVHKKPVKWLKIFKKPINLNDELYDSLSSPQDSIHEITNENVKKIIINYINNSGNYYVETNDGANILFNENILENEIEELENEANELNDDDLLIKAKTSDKEPIKREIFGTQYQRNPYVSGYAKRRSKGICELCNNPAPFFTMNNIPFLETHHIIPLSEGGYDEISNTVALCPNCHRKMHSLKKVDEIKSLKMKAKES